MQILECEQRTEAWYSARRGLPTASAMSKLFTSTHQIPKKPTQTMLDYAAELAADAFSGLPLSNEEGFQGSWATERGLELEDVARRSYEFLTGHTVRQVGLVTNHGAACSPDALVNDDGLLEVKCPLAKRYTQDVADMVAGKCPAGYYVQVQAQLWLCEREWASVLLFHPHLHEDGVTLRVEPDEKFQALLKQQVEVILAERDRLVEALRKAA